MNQPKVTIHWFRRDLRTTDNHGLYRALIDHGDVLPLFIFDTTILDKLENKQDRRLDFIHRTLVDLEKELARVGSSMVVEHGEPAVVWQRILDRYDVKAVTVNHDHEPYAIDRDARISALLASRDIPFRSFKDISIFERDEVVKDDGKPYTVFTPYMKKWRAQFTPDMMEAFPSERSLLAHFTIAAAFFGGDRIRADGPGDPTNRSGRCLAGQLPGNPQFARSERYQPDEHPLALRHGERA